MFAFSAGFPFSKIPPFVVGRRWIDYGLNAFAVKNKYPLIDVSLACGLCAEEVSISDEDAPGLYVLPEPRDDQDAEGLLLQLRVVQVAPERQLGECGLEDMPFGDHAPAEVLAFTLRSGFVTNTRISFINGREIVVHTLIVQNGVNASLRHHAHLDVLGSHVRREHVLEHLKRQLDHLFVVVEKGLASDLLFQVIYSFL